jgi:hypothetical protein
MRVTIVHSPLRALLRRYYCSKMGESQININTHLPNRGLRDVATAAAATLAWSSCSSLVNLALMA